MVGFTELLLSGFPSSSSTHHHDHNHIYDVFLSFRGADTRKSFTDHLYKALWEAGYNTFLDDADIETGEPLKQELKSAIKSSRASAIVLSKNYAFSTWCLDELVLILEQKRKRKQIVIPIFYDVEPTDVRKQQKSFGEAMAKHKHMMMGEMNLKKRIQWAQKIELWERALTKVADIKGKDAKDRMETKLIEEIVNDLYSRLGVPLGTTTVPRLIGMKDYIERITSWLKDGASLTTDVLTVCGMAGIGKTSLVKYAYELHRHEYMTSIFVGDISRRSDGKYHGWLDVQKQLCDEIFKSQIKSQVRTNHIEVLLSGLDEYNSLALLCIHAFNSHSPKEGFIDVSEKLVKYCQGHPLALQVLGRSLHKQDVANWEDRIKVLKKEPHPDIKKALHMSIDLLPSENDKKLFKHIACFFVGMIYENDLRN